MADELNTNNGEATVDTLNALHLDGKGQATLDNADERTLDRADAQTDDVQGLANIQSANRNTHEQIAQGAPDQAPTVPTGDRVVVDRVAPTEPDHNVEARFTNIQPEFAPPPPNVPHEPPVNAGGLPLPEPDLAPPQAPTQPLTGPVTGTEGGQNGDQGFQAAAAGDPGTEPAPLPPDAPGAPPAVPNPAIPALHLQPASGWEDLPLKLDLSADLLTHQGENVGLTVTIGNLPTGFTLVSSTGGSVGIHNADGSYTFTADQLSDVYLSRPHDWSGDLTLNVTASTNDATISQGLPVHVEPIADQPTLAASAVGVEDKWAALNISTAVTDTDGSEVISGIYVTGLHTGMTLSAGHALTADVTLSDGTVIPAGTWALAPGDLSGLKINGLDAESNSAFNLNIMTVSHETGAHAASNTQYDAVNSTTITVKMFGDADMPVLTVDTAPKEILEDAFFNLGSAVTGQLTEAGSLLDGTHSFDGSETLTFRIYPVEGNLGLRLAISPDSNISPDEIQALPASGYWTVSAADIAAGKVYIGAAGNWASSTGQASIHFDIQAVSTENDAGANTSALNGTGLTRNDTAISDPQRVTLVVDPVADKATIVAQNTGNEDQVGGIDVTPHITLGDIDGSEHLINDVTIISSDADLINGHLELNGVTLVPTANGDGTYTWHVPLTALGSPAGSTYPAGTDYVVNGLKFFPASNEAGDVDYKIKVTVQDTNATVTQDTITDGHITVLAVADAPTVAVGAATTVGGVQVVEGVEDTTRALHLGAQLTDAAGGDPESLSRAELSGVPDGWQVGYVDSNGVWTAASHTSNGNGLNTWSLDPSKLDQVAFRAPANLSVSLTDGVNFTFTATSSESGPDAQVAVRDASTSTSFSVVVDAVADAPALYINHARTSEDVPVKLDIQTALTDTDGSESITAVFIQGAPTGTTFQDATGHQIGVRGTLAADGTFTADSNGNTWMFTQSQLSNLYLSPTHDSNVSFDLSIISRSTEASNGDYADTTGTLKVLLHGVSDGPSIPAGALDANGNLVASGVEDQLINPGFGGYGTVDVDGSETLSIVLHDIPAGVTVQMTAGNAQYLQYIGTDTNGNARWAVDPGHIGDVRFSTTANYAGTFTVGVDLITTENDGDSAAITKTMVVNVDARADAPSVSIGAQVSEDGWGSDGIRLSVSANPTDTVDGVEHITSVTVNVDPAGLPPGTHLQLELDGQLYEVGAGGGITLSGSLLASHYDATTGAISGVTLVGVPANWSKDLSVSVQATSTDINGTTATSTATGTIGISAVADAPATFDVGPSVSGTAGAALDLGLSATLTDTDGSESMYFIVSGVPNGVTLNHGFSNGDGTWTVPYTPGDASWHLSASSVYTGSATLTLTPVVVDKDPDGGQDLASFPAKTIDITVTGGTGGPWSAIPAGVPPTLAAAPVAGLEDHTFTLAGVTVTAGASGDTVSAIVVTGIPAGATVSGGYYNPLNGSWTIDPAHAADFVVTPPKDFSGDLTFQMHAVSIHDGVTIASTDSTVLVAHLDPVTDGGTFTMSAATGQMEDPSSPIAISMTINQLDTDHSESLVAGSTVTIHGLPAGSVLYQNGVALTADANGDYHVAVGDITGLGSVAVTGLAVQPPLNFSGTLSFTASVDFHDGTASAVTSTGTLNIPIGAVADAPVVSATDASGSEDAQIALSASVTVTDVIGTGTYGSEHLSIVISGVPNDAVIAGATNNNDGTWTISADHFTLAQNGSGAWVATLNGVSILPPRDYNGTFDLTVTAYTMEDSNHSVASGSDTLHVSVGAIADTPTIHPSNVTGVEDGQTTLHLGSQLVSLSESLYVVIHNVATGASFTDGAGHSRGIEVQVDTNGNPMFDSAMNPVAVTSGTHTGVWIFNGTDASSLSYIGAHDASGTFTMTAQAWSVDGTSTAHSDAMPFTVTLSGVADTPTLSIGHGDIHYVATGLEDQAGGIPLDIQAALTDTDGSETLNLIIGGAPAGSTFLASNGHVISAGSDGMWHLSSADLAGLTIQPPTNWDQNFTLSVTAQSSEDGTTATSSGTLAVHVTPVNDAPYASIIGATGQSEFGALNDPIRVIPQGTGDGSHFQVSDVDGSHLTGMSIQMTTGAQAGDGFGMVGVNLALDGNGHLIVAGTDITVSYDAAHSTLSFSGFGDYSTYAKLAESVTLSNSSGTITAGQRAMTISVFDEEGAMGSTNTYANIGDTNTHTNVTLHGDALGEVFWGSSGQAMLAGGTGNDTFILGAGDHVSSIDGGLGGVNQLLLQAMPGHTADWTMTQNQDGSISAISASDPDHSFVIHINSGTVDAAHSDASTVAFNGEASGTIDFNDASHTHVAFQHLDRITT